ncbi:MAG TPA: ATP-binding protein [Puia sp.]|nr:ATP-binding protein [Puia sp.]
MKILSNKNFFQPRARLLLQLGDKLIKNENIALLELIKNSYDADAKRVKIRLENVDKKKYGTIDILDDGEGMDISIIETVWLEPGSDYKANLFAKKIRTKKYKRLPVGEKGIGRFGVHKLGNRIELISRMLGSSTEVVVKIDWNKFGEHKYLKDAKFEVFERTPEYFIRNRVGTRITVSDLRTDWDRKMVREFYKSVFTLNSPFQKPGNFQVQLEIDNKDLVEDLPNWEDVKEFALWHFQCKLSGHEIKEFTYEFIPWESMDGLQYKRFTEEDDFIINNNTLLKANRENPKEEIIINLNKNYGEKGENKTIGEVNFEGYIFDRDRAILELSGQQGLALLKQYLDEQGGIRVYRENVRINEYGEKGNDWLGLDIRRVNLPAKRISNNIVLAVIDLKIEGSTALIEKTNREGFIENEAFHDFSEAILFVLGLIETLRKIDKDLIREKYNPTEKEEPVLFHLGELKQLIEDKIKDEPLKNQIIGHLNKIESDYNEINDILLTSAGAGLTLAVGVHEVQKIIEELNQVIKLETVPDKILALVQHLDKLIENYSDLLRQSDGKEENILKLITGAIFNIEYRLQAHNVSIVGPFQNYKGSNLINCSKRLVLGSIINIIDNSIYWLEKKYKKLKEVNEVFDKKIFIDVIEDKSGFLDVVIADNGFGFNLPTQQIVKPFISNKPGGMGLGLHIAKEVMKVQGGSIIFPAPKDYDIPSEFKKGAIIVLKLKRG